ncbi:YbdK family carboxylate-amine ligase [Aeromicrobium camelliae]|uniref:Putative glutamate--cysteine ligase 2 n=2 Tax=Aeromicrobium TaxID=2040 RepID=A0A3N6YE87_9ACTN|nr:YbdK family carboxylate-amine ligase [Aeromicrobium camelliae]RQN08124.1 YbdK family carboxylate-amine ligase [Aeromicrobium camelliae]
MRTFGVEEELLLIDATTLDPLPAGDWAASLQMAATDTGHEVTAELQQEQIEVAAPPQTTMTGQLEAILTGRALAEQAAAKVGGRVAALPTSPGFVEPHLGPDSRYRRIDSRDEGVAVLDRIRVWLPTLLALSANSPFWHGTDTGYASYRYQAWSRWPTAGPVDLYGSAEAYERHQAAMLATGVPLDAAMLYYDARLSEHQPTLEVRIADVCLNPADAAVIATLTRALVEMAVRESHQPAPEVPASLLRLWSWQASHSGVHDRLIDPATGTPVPARDVIARLLDVVRPALVDYGDEEHVEVAIARILEQGTGARIQRQAYAVQQEVRDVVTAALEITHASPAGGDRVR